MEHITAWCNDKDGTSMVRQRFFHVLLVRTIDITAYISNFNDIKWGVNVH